MSYAEARDYSVGSYALNVVLQNDYLNKSVDVLQSVAGETSFSQGIYQPINTVSVLNGDTIDFRTEFIGLVSLDPNPVLPPNNPPTPPQPLSSLPNYLENSYSCVVYMDNVPTDIPTLVYTTPYRTITPNIELPTWVSSSALTFKEASGRYGIAFNAVYTPPVLQPGWITPPVPRRILIQYYLIRPSYTPGEPTPPEEISNPLFSSNNLTSTTNDS